MKLRQFRCLFLIIMPVILFSQSAVQAEEPKEAAFYVRCDGNDTASGRSFGEAFATIGRARDAVRKLKKSATLPKGGVTIWIGAGRYCLEQTFELTAEDSGSVEGAITWRAMPDAQVRIVGGREIGGWQKVQEQSILARLEPAARGNVYQTELRAQGIKDFGQMRSRGFARQRTPAALELFFEDKPMKLARWPNSGFLKITGYPEITKDDFKGELGKLAEGFNYEGDRPGRWKDVNDIWVHGYWAYDWANSYEHVRSLDLQKHLVKTSPPYGNYGFRSGGEGGRFYFLNILEELDEPGEWYLERKSGILYFWPPAPIERGSAEISILETPVIDINGASYIKLCGLTIECSRGDGVRITGGSNNVIEKCILRNLGNYGVIADGGRSHSVVGCDIYDTGDGGISLAGGDRKTLTPGLHTAENNRIHDISRWSRTYAPAISMTGVGNGASNNLIYSLPHCAISFSGNEQIIELNEIHDVCLETGDVGAIYTGRNYTFRGNIVRYNFIHHTGGVGMGSMGIYMDDCVSGTQIYGNVLWKLHRAVFLGGGRDFKIENNIFVDCDPAIELDCRGLSKLANWHDMIYVTMKKGLEEMNWKQPPYSTRYPELAELEKFYGGDYGIPPGNILAANNICVGDKWLQLNFTGMDEAVTSRDNMVGADPCFVNPSKGDFRLKENSPAFKLGFKKIPFEQIGLLKEGAGTKDKSGL